MSLILSSFNSRRTRSYPSISISPSSGTASVSSGGTVDVTITLTRNDTPQFAIELRRDTSGKSRTRAMARRSDGTSAIGEVVQNQYFDLIGAGSPMDLGTWNTLRAHFKVESSAGAADGKFVFWVNGTKLFDHTRAFNAFQPAGYGRGCRYGYLHGSANAGFTDVTVFHTQYLRFYDANPEWV
jgi:hypothetical protein